MGSINFVLIVIGILLLSSGLKGEVNLSGCSGYVALTPVNTGDNCGSQTAPCNSLGQLITDCLQTKPTNITIILANGTYSGVDNYGFTFFGVSIVIQADNGSAPVIDLTGATVPFISVSGGSNTSSSAWTMVSLTGVTVINGNLSQGNGSVVNVNLNTLTNVLVSLNDCTFANNSAVYGGAFYFSVVNNGYQTTNVQFSSSKLIGNSALNQGGAIFSAFEVSVEISSTAFSGNHASGGGSTIYSIAYSLNMTSSSIENTNVQTVAAIYLVNQGSPTYISICQFSQNTGQSNTTAIIAAVNSRVNISTSTFENNRISSVMSLNSYYSDLGAITISGCKFYDNNVGPTVGAALRAYTHSSFTILNSNFTGNYALSGGVVYAFQADILKFSGCNFIANTASNYGGVFYGNNTNEISIQNSVFQYNAGQRSSANIYCTGSTFELSPSQPGLELSCDSIDGCTFIGVDESCSSEETDSTGHHKGLSGGQIAGIVIGILAVVIIASAVAYVLFKRKHRNGYLAI